MKKLFALTVMVIVMAGALAGCQSEPKIKDNFGKTYSKTELKGHWVVLNYWATWCESCKTEIPELNAFYKEHQKDNVLIFGINYDNLQGKPLQLGIKQYAINYPVLESNPATWYQLGSLNVVPATFIINPKGEVVKKILGPLKMATLDSIIV